LLISPAVSKTTGVYILGINVTPTAMGVDVSKDITQHLLALQHKNIARI
jgi:hypothetical protein